MSHTRQPLCRRSGGGAACRARRVPASGAHVCCSSSLSCGRRLIHDFDYVLIFLRINITLLPGHLNSWFKAKSWPHEAVVPTVPILVHD